MAILQEHQVNNVEYLYTKGIIASKDIEVSPETCMMTLTCTCSHLANDI